MILIYSEEISPRLDFISRLIFNQILGVEVRFTTDSSEFSKSKSPKINYSFKRFGEEFYIRPHSLLFSKTLNQQDLSPVLYDGEIYLFESSADSELPFDPLAASFYLASRYEEYLEQEHDKFNRFFAEKSILSQNNLLKKPVVNIWAGLIGEKLKLRFPELIFPERKFRFSSTIDIDNAWAFKHKGIWRCTGAFLRSVLKGNFRESAGRIKVWAGLEGDPYDTYDFLDCVFSGNEDKVKFFFLLGDYKKYDKNLSYKNKYFRRLIKEISEKYKIGIHPSYASGQEKGYSKIVKEHSRLESILDKKVTSSRQHFLVLRFPQTYRRLLSASIQEDFSMGHASEAGFRAGICTPFYFYDLEKEHATNLLIHPFQVMDVTLCNYMKLSPEQALSEILELMKEVKKVGGTFVSIWHNETLNDLGEWKGFRAVFEKMNQTGFKWANE